MYRGNGQSNKVAYIGARDMYITRARVTDTLYVGDNDENGFFTWSVTNTGLGLKYVGKD